MKKHIIPLLTALAVAFPAMSHAVGSVTGSWQIHNTFDYYFSEIIDTPQRTYVLALGQMVNSSHAAWSTPQGQLFMLDKQSGELTGYNAGNYLNGNVILDIAYNPAKGYLMIVYDNYNIDMLYDDNTLYSVPALSSPALSVSKNVNSITFDPQTNIAYLATDFGYVAIDDDNRVVVESRIYNKPLNCVARMGEQMLAGTDEGLFVAQLSDRRTSFDAFRPVDAYTAPVSYLLPLNGDNLIGVVDDGSVSVATFNEAGTVDKQVKENSKMAYCSDNKDGYFMRRNGFSCHLDHDGNISVVYTDKTGYGSTVFSSWDMKDFYFPVLRSGVLRKTYLGSYKWDTDERLYEPNAPGPYSVFYFDYSPVAGELAGNGTFNRFYNWGDMNYSSVVSGYAKNKWTRYGLITFENPLKSAVRESYGPVVDPVDPNYIWLGTRRAGLARFDMRDNSLDLYSHPSHAQKNQPGFHAVFPTSIYWTMLCNVSAPSFDADGNLWCVFNPSHAKEGLSPLYCWKAADRKADNVSAFKEIPVKGYGVHYDNMIITATKTQASKDFVVFGPSTRYYDPFYLFYHGGTIDDTSDDRLLCYKSFVDQDGNSVSYTFFNMFYEDAETGNIWVGTDSGLFHFNPNEALAAGDDNGRLRVNRVKIPASDGTDMTDYLLNGYDVTSMTVDADGRKWFATHGSGVFVTTADGSEILDHFTRENSLLPSDNVFALGLDPSTGAVWIGNEGQTAVFYCNPTQENVTSSDILAFPNPVRPGHQGGVTIQGLDNASSVMIADRDGNILKELAVPSSGVTVWDMTTTDGTPVSPSTYFILTPETGNALTERTTSVMVVR